MKPELVRKSKWLSKILRHTPEAVDSEGWAEVSKILTEMKISREDLEEIVETNEKQRFSLAGDRIRARQGHTVEVDLGFTPVKPPDKLWHGTATKFLEAIQAKGLLPMSRQYVHLSADRSTALKVGQRHGTPVLLEVNTKAMSEVGFEFYLSENNVWLTANVPVTYLRVSE